MVLDPKTTVCILAADTDTRVAIKKAKAAFRKRVAADGLEYYFSAVGFDVSVVEEQYTKVVVVSLWVERCPREG